MDSQLLQLEASYGTFMCDFDFLKELLIELTSIGELLWRN